MAGSRRQGTDLTRRTLLRMGASLAALGAGGGLLRPSRAGASMTPAGAVSAVTGEGAVSMAMHVHGSFSEGTASMEAHLQQAAASGIDVLWWTDHNQRMAAHGYRQAVHFNGPVESENGLAWTWSAYRSGSLAASTATWVTSPVSPYDSAPAGALRMRAVSSGAAEALWRQDGKVQLDLTRTSLAGHRVLIDVLPLAVSSKAWVGVEIITSYRPARDGRPAGVYRLSYRIGGGRAVGTKVRSTTKAIVTLAAPVGTWSRLDLDPARDLGDVFGIDGRDASMYTVGVATCSATSAPAEAVFDNLSFTRSANQGQQPLVVQRELMAHYAGQFPSVVQHQGIEISHIVKHIGSYGGTPTLPDLTGWPVTPPNDMVETRRVVDAVHTTGGIASYNHPFGTGGNSLTEAAQETARRKVARELIANSAVAADLFEVGYRVRGGVTLARHASVWDALSSNGVFLTGSGVSDDHSGRDWLGQLLNFVTSVWTPSGTRDEGSLVQALRGGRAFFSDPARFRGTIDLLVDGAAPMGSVTVSTATTRSVRVLGSGWPAGSTFQVVDGLVGYAGTTSPDPQLRLSTVSAGAEVDVALTVDTRTSRFVRVVVRDASGQEVALSNPVWLLRDQPPGGIPAARAL